MNRSAGRSRRRGPAMMVTLTPNPSIDRTVALSSRLERGAVLRAESITSQSGGKGVHISIMVAAFTVVALKTFTESQQEIDEIDQVAAEIAA